MGQVWGLTEQVSTISNLAINLPNTHMSKADSVSLQSHPRELNSQFGPQFGSFGGADSFRTSQRSIFSKSWQNLPLVVLFILYCIVSKLLLHYSFFLFLCSLKLPRYQSLLPPVYDSEALNSCARIQVQCLHDIRPICLPGALKFCPGSPSQHYTDWLEF